MSRVNIWMSEELHKKLKIMVALKGMTIQEYVEDSIEKKVKKDLKLVEELIKKDE